MTARQVQTTLYPRPRLGIDVLPRATDRTTVRPVQGPDTTTTTSGEETP